MKITFTESVGEKGKERKGKERKDGRFPSVSRRCNDEEAQSKTRPERWPLLSSLTPRWKCSYIGVACVIPSGCTSLLKLVSPSILPFSSPIEVVLKNGKKKKKKKNRRRNEPMSSSSFAIYVVHARVFGSNESKRSKLSVVIVRAIRKSSYFTYTIDTKKADSYVHRLEEIIIS